MENQDFQDTLAEIRVPNAGTQQESCSPSLAEAEIATLRTTSSRSHSARAKIAMGYRGTPADLRVVSEGMSA